MERRQKVGGIAALVAAGTFLFGIVLFVSLLTDYTTGDPTPAESVSFLVDNQAALYIWNLVIFIVFGIALVPLVLVLRERLKPGSPGLAQAAGAFGLIWAGLVLAAGMVSNIAIGTIADLYDTDPAAAEPVWSALDSVQNGLGGGNEIAGGVWVLLVSWAALTTAVLPPALNYLGLTAGAAGLITVIPALEGVGAVFGIGLIIWFAWAGVVLVKEDTPADGHNYRGEESSSQERTRQRDRRSALLPSRPMLLGVRDLTDPRGTQLIFALTAAILNYSLYRTRLVPRFISIWGLAGIAADAGLGPARVVRHGSPCH